MKDKKKKINLFGIISIIILAIILIIVLIKNSSINDVTKSMSFVNDEKKVSYINVDEMSHALNGTDLLYFHIVKDNDNYFIVKINSNEWEKTREIREYTYNRYGNVPESVRLVGKTKEIDEKIIEAAINTYSSLTGSIDGISYDEFYRIFGNYYLDVQGYSANGGAIFLIYTIIILISLLLIYNFKKKGLTSFVLLFISWVLMFIVNTPDDFSNNALVICSFAFIIVNTVFFSYFLIKNNKKTNNNKPLVKSDNSVKKSEIKVEQNEYSDISDNKLLEKIYDYFDEFMEKNEIIFYHFSRETLNRLDIEELMENVAYYKKSFLSSLFVKMYLNSNSKEKKKTKTFLKNIDDDVLDELNEYFGLKDEELNKIIGPDSEYLDYYNFNAWLKKASNYLSKKYDSGITHDEWLNFIKNIENAYNSYVNPEKTLDLLGIYAKSSDDNKHSSSINNFLFVFIPIILIIIMVIMFFCELTGEHGIILNNGWISAFVFISLIIALCIGLSGKSNTCSNCNKWGSLELTSDYIIDTEDTWRRKTKMDSNGRNYQVNVPVRIEKHEQHFECKHCGNREVKYVSKEYEL